MEILTGADGGGPCATTQIPLVVRGLASYSRTRLPKTLRRRPASRNGGRGVNRAAPTLPRIGPRLVRTGDGWRQTPAAPEFGGRSGTPHGRGWPRAAANRARDSTWRTPGSIGSPRCRDNSAIGRAGFRAGRGPRPIATRSRAAVPRGRADPGRAPAARASTARAPAAGEHRGARCDKGRDLAYHCRAPAAPPLRHSRCRGARPVAVSPSHSHFADDQASSSYARKRVWTGRTGTRFGRRAARYPARRPAPPRARRVSAGPGGPARAGVCAAAPGGSPVRRH